MTMDRKTYLAGQAMRALIASTGISMYELISERGDAENTLNTLVRISWKLAKAMDDEGEKWT